MPRPHRGVDLQVSKHRPFLDFATQCATLKIPSGSVSNLSVCTVTDRGATFISRCRTSIPTEPRMKHKRILLVEDDPDDEALTVRALKKSDVLNEVVVVRDGVEALNYLFCEGPFAGSVPRPRPQIVLLDLKLPKL